MIYIMLPIHPQWCEKILNRDKSIEVRKGTTLYNAINKLIKEQGKAPCLMYCTKGKEKLFDNIPCVPRFRVSKNYQLDNYLNGKVVAMFEAEPDRIFNVRFGADEDECAREHAYETPILECEELERSSCLEYDQLLKYLGREWDDGCIGTAIHVKPGTMKIFDKPKELKEFNKVGAPTYEQTKAILRGGYTMEQHKKYLARFGYAVTKAPQSWCYVEVDE